ncbi:MAG: bifunctional tRNA (5-methylaminomethyl-2-thiouridine)(34)-methyltransferase MnmD/FAD-dependent 5-carboxymethylaminomethyl-2-thiouridine(34) oxidoreductase MnmC [Pseudohongiellaceae bacterium]
MLMPAALSAAPAAVVVCAFAATTTAPMLIDNARLDWLENGLPYSSQFDDVYFSRADARGESRHVFLEANCLRERWRASSINKSSINKSAINKVRPQYVIGELGFGCGLNFLQTWRLWQQTRAEHPGLRLHYLALEKYPLRHADLTRILALWPDLEDLAAPLLAQYPEHSAGCHRLQLADDVTLDLYYGDAEARLAELVTAGQRERLKIRLKIDTWYADGFSPRQNPELWSAPLFQHLARLSATGATLSTYSVARPVRDGLRAAGFTLERLPGFANKREMLRATLCQPAAAAPVASATPWFILPAPAPVPRRALVVGAGLAGASQALSLARRGIDVTVVAAADAPPAASANRQLALRCRLFARASELAGFYLHSFLYSRRLLAAAAGDIGACWHATGVLQFADAVNKRRPLEPEALAGHYAEAVVTAADAAALSRHAGLGLGLGLGQEGLHFPLGGWVEGERLCAALLAHPRIRLQRGAAVAELQSHMKSHTESHAPGWRLLDSHGTVLAEAEAVILANGAGVNAFTPTGTLPLETVRGQTTLIPETPASAALATVVCGERTVFPAHEGVHTLAASYHRHDARTAATADEDRDNLERARRVFAAPQVLSAQPTGNWVALRANTPDRNPLLGQVPDFPAMAQRYRTLARDATTTFAEPGVYLPGLYINAAHGSNGLATAPFASEILASLLCHEQPPVSQSVLDLLNPVRFLIRELKRQQSADESV